MNPFHKLKNVDKQALDKSIHAYQKAEQHWNEEQAMDWIQNVLNEKYPSDITLSKVLADGVVLCRLLLKVDKDAISKYHPRPKASIPLSIENINYFLEGCKKIDIPTMSINPLDLIENRRMREVIACLEQLMRRSKVQKNRRFKWPAKTVRIKLFGTSTNNNNNNTNSSESEESEETNNKELGDVEMEITPDTMVAELKTALAEAHHVPLKERRKYAIFIRRTTTIGATPDAIIQQNSTNDSFWLDDDSALGDHDFDADRDEISYQKMKKQLNKLIKNAVSPYNVSELKMAEDGNVSSKDPMLLKGDQITLYFHNISHIHHRNAIVGDLYITKLSLIFQPFQHTEETPYSPCAEKGFRIPLTSVMQIIKCGGMKADLGKFYCFEIECKDFNRLKFSYLHNPTINGKRRNTGSRYPGANVESFSEPLSDLLLRHVMPDTQALFAWLHTGNVGGIDGWRVYNAQKEYARQGIPDQYWRITTMNSEYGFSDTYPSTLVVPAAITDKQLEEVFKYRSRGRIPVLCYRHPSARTALLRCSQPRAGMTGKKCAEDELLFSSIGAENSLRAHRVVIIDARPLVNAVVNQVMGKGFEKEYQGCEVRFCGIENIHVMRNSLNKLRKACRTTDPEKRQARVHASEWLLHVQMIVNASLEIVNEMAFNNSSVVVHCSDGWDRTTQLCTLAQLIMDPYFRTIEGFEVLIEKDWLSFGHKFDQRIGHTNHNYKDDQRSPIFLQWLDSVWQVMNQFPDAFEFNHHFLHIIYSHVISCCFGTFLFNSEMERMQASIRSKTISLWSHINFHVEQFKRKSFVPVTGTLCTKMDPVKFWKEEHLFWYHYHEGVN